jgi:drug/metabolite transporter (DMT)-like permease
MVLAGVLIVAASEDGEGDGRQATRGSILAAVMSHVAFAAGTMLGQHYAPLLGTLETTWLQRLGGAILILAIWLISREPKTVPSRFAPMLLAMGLLDITAIGMLNHAGNLPHPEIAIVGGSSAVLVTVVLARIFLKERIVALRWAGIAVSFAGVAMLSLTTG